MLSKTNYGESFYLNRDFGGKLLRNSSATIVYTVLTEGGVCANGKVTADRYLPAFNSTLLENNISVIFVSNIEQLERMVTQVNNPIIIHLFGEDHADITSERMLSIEQSALAVFNSSLTGKVLSDKLLSENIFRDYGVPVPKRAESAGFVRQRYGTAQEVQLFENSNASANFNSDIEVSNEFVNTVQYYDGVGFYTTVRTLCINDTVLHSYVRARAVFEGNPSVHAKNTPKVPSLIEQFQDKLVTSNLSEIKRISSQLYRALGNGFYSHDLLIDNCDGKVYVCESGFKFDDLAYWGHLSSIKNEVPSHSLLFPVENFAADSAKIFISICKAITSERDES